MSTAVPYSSPASDGAVASNSQRLILASGFQPDYVREVANAHARLGCAVTVIGGDMHAGQTYHENVTLRNLRGSNASSGIFRLCAYYFRMLAVVAWSDSPVLYDVSIGRPLLRCLLMYPLFRLLGKKIVYTAHNVLPHDDDSLRNRIVYWVVYRCLVDAIVVHGQSLKERLAEEFDVDPDRIYVVVHGTYHPAETPHVTRESARDRLQIAQNDCVLLCFGLQRYYKGTHFVLDALKGYDANGLTLLIRGHAPDPTYQEFLERQIEANQSGVSINAEFGVVPDADLELYFKASDIVLLPYLDGSQSGIKFMAYAFGRPVLASEIGSLCEYIAPGITGETFATGDVEAFREILEHMVARCGTYSEERIKSYAREHCSFDAAAKQVDALCGQLTK